MNNKYIKFKYRLVFGNPPVLKIIFHNHLILLYTILKDLQTKKPKFPWHALAYRNKITN